MELEVIQTIEDNSEKARGMGLAKKHIDMAQHSLESTKKGKDMEI